MRLSNRELDVSQRNAGRPVGTGFALGRRMSADIVIGRTLACCVHPAAAWRRLPASGKAVIITTYFAVSYFGVLALLLSRQ
jgi:hypothetical protein